MKSKVLNWLQQFNTFCFLDSNLYEQEDKMQDVLVGAGFQRRYSSSSPAALSGLQQFINEKQSWLFGHLGYELAIDAQYLHQPKKDELQFPDVFFFEPEIILQIKPGAINILAPGSEEVYQSICKAAAGPASASSILQFNSKISREAYLENIRSLQNHIQRGNCYEINFCQEFFAKHVSIDPFTLFEKLNTISPNPFSALYHFNDHWLLCASPERFLQKKGNRLMSQPIKGTLPRKAGSARDIAKQQAALLQSEKDRAENVMVVDLVRNDLSRVCKEGSVKVDELFGIYSFPQVHQMISTISGELPEGMDFSTIINATFPMGSMTGAPKIRVMQLIEQYEQSKRGIFSGALGYIDPAGNFDFNVVIRSLMYNAASQYLSYQVGSGITAYSNAEQEWEECMVKGKAIQEILGI